MNIQNISKKESSVTMELSADDLVIICNALSAQYDASKERETFLQLYSDMMMARDLCQYGHVDNFCLQNIVKCRNGIGNGLNGMLSDRDIDTFHTFLERGDISAAFRNPDWKRIYEKIVGKHGKARSSEKIKNWMEKEGKTRNEDV